MMRLTKRQMWLLKQGGILLVRGSVTRISGPAQEPFNSKDIMRLRRTTRYENGVDWKGEDGQREDEFKCNARELAFQRCTQVSGRTTRYCHTSMQMNLHPANCTLLEELSSLLWCQGHRIADMYAALDMVTLDALPILLVK